MVVIYVKNSSNLTCRFFLVALILLTLWYSLSAYSQDAPLTDNIPAPNPAALGSNWWGYFGKANEQLKLRIEGLDQHLRTIVNDKLGSEQAGNQTYDQAISIIDEIVLNLYAYLELVNKSPPPLVNTPAVTDEFSLSSYLNLNSQVKDAQAEFELEQEEIEHRNIVIKQSREKLDDAFALYIEDSKYTSSHLLQGLSIMRDRTRIEVVQQELKLLVAQQKRKKEWLKELKTILNLAENNLSASSEDIDTYIISLELVKSELALLNEEATVLRLRSNVNSDTPLGKADSKFHRQILLDIDARIANAELARVQNLVEVALTSHLNGTVLRDDSLNLVDSLAELNKKLVDIEYSSQIWRRATNLERSAAESQLALVKNSSKELAELHNARIKLADNTIQTLAVLRDNITESHVLRHVAEQQIAREKGTYFKWLTAFKQNSSEFWDRTGEFSTSSLFTINETPMTLLGLFRALAILAVAWWISKLVRKGLDRFGQNSTDTNRASLYTVGRLFHYTALIVGVLIGLSSLGLDFTKLTLFVSALGVGMGFGLQAIFSNFVAGLMILFEKSLKVGDFVELESGVTGQVNEISIRSTLITTNDNIDILVPNSEFVSGRVTNWTLREVSRRVHIPFGVAYGTDKELVRKAALEAAAAVSHTFKNLEGRRPQVWLVGFGDNSLNFELVVWLNSEAVSRPGAVNAAYTWELETVLAKYNIEIPFPQRDLHFRTNSISENMGIYDPAKESMSN